MKPFLKNFLRIFSSRRHAAFLTTLGAVFVLTIALFPGFARADAWTSGTQAILGFIFELLFAFLGPLLSAIIASLVDVAKYNNIIGQTTIKTAWTTVRDIVNMFFIFAILLIAFSTILRIRQYEAKQLLPKLVLYAVLVNFSLTICGIFIDIAQIFTLTFVSAFQDSAVNNFANITKMMDYASVKLDGPVGARDILAGYILGTALLVVSIVVIGALVLVLLARILFLWVLAILSPFVFVLPIIPGGQKYSSQWWSMFSSYVISGPLLAFFIWLSLTVMSQQKIGSEIIKSGSVKIVKTTMGEPTFLLDYVMGMGMLIVGLILTQKLGGMTGAIAGGATNRLKGAAMGAANWTRRRIGPTGMITAGAAVLTGGASLGLAAGGALAGKYLPRMANFGLRNFEGMRIPGTNMRIPGTRDTVVGRWAQDRYDRRRENNERGRQRFMEQTLGMGERTFERLSDRGNQLNIPRRPGTPRNWGDIWRVPATFITGTTFGAADRATQTRRNARADANNDAATGVVVRNNPATFNLGRDIDNAGAWYTNRGLPERRFHSLHFANNDSAYLYRHGLDQVNNPDIGVRQAMLNAMAQYVAEQTTRGGQINQPIQNILNDNANGLINSGGLTPGPNLRSAFMTSINQEKMQKTMIERERLGLGEVSSEDLVKTAEAAKIDRDFAIRQKTPAREVILERMRQGESPDDIINSVKNYEEKVAKGEYYNGDRVNDVKRQQKVYEEWEKKGDVNEMTGIRGSERDVSKGRSAQLAVNFDDETLKGLNLQGAGGAYISGENKQSTVDALSEYLYKQLSIDNSKKDSGQQKTDEDIVKEVDQFKQMLQQAKGIALINKAQTGLGADERSLHEKFHRNLNDVDQGQMMGAWNAMPEEERKNAEEKIRGTIKGGKDMPLEEVVEEYLVEGLTNATGRGRGATKLDQKTLDQVEQMGIVRKIDQKTATGEMRTIYRPTKEAAEEIPKSGTLKTEEEFKKHNEQVAAQYSAQTAHKTLTEKAAQEEEIEITGDEEIEGKEEKEEAPAPEEEKKEEKSAQASAGYREQDYRSVPEIRNIIREVGETGKGEIDTRFFSRVFDRLDATIGSGISGIGKMQAEQMGKLSKTIKGLQEAASHAQSNNPLEQRAAKQEYDIKLEEFKNEYYNTLGEDPASEQEIEGAIKDVK